MARLAGLTVVALTALVPAAPAQATFPGANGRIAFTWSRGGEGYESGPHPRLVGVVSIRPNGSGRKLVARGASNPVYSPDGKRIAFIRRTGIWLAHADGDHARVLTPAGWFVADQRWSPGGTRLAFVRSGRGTWNALYTVRRDGSDLKRLVKAPTQIELSSTPWAPNGKAIAYTQVRSNARPLVRIFRDGRVTTLAPLGGGATWSRHGLIAYGLGTGFADFDKVCLRRAATGDIVRCFGDRGVVTGGLGWTPDGTRLMLMRGGDGVLTEVLIVRPDGTVVSRTPYPLERATAPVISPDGRRFAFTRYSGHGDPRLAYSDLHVMRVDGTNVRRIVQNGWVHPPDVDAPDWQPRPR